MKNRPFISVIIPARNNITSTSSSITGFCGATPIGCSRTCDDCRFDSVLEGCLLGDGNLRSEYGVTSRFKQDSKFQEYLSWLKKYFTKTGIKTSKISKRVHTKINNAITYSFYSWSSKRLKEFYDRWYPNGKKIIPKDFWLDSTKLLHWYLGDGSLVFGSGRKRKNKSIRLYTDAFNKEDVLRLILEVKKVTKCNPSYQKSRNSIYIKDKEVELFLDSIEPWGRLPIKCFDYKFKR